MFIKLTDGLNDANYINDERIESISSAIAPPNDKCKSYIMFSSGTSSYYQETPDEIFKLIRFVREPQYAEHKMPRW